MNKITSILFLYITFLPAFSYAAFPDNIMTGMAGALYTNQSAHATNTDEYDELKKTVTECVNKTKQKNKSAPENYITNRANELKKNALTRNINYSTHVNFSTNDKRPKNFTCNITAKVGDFLKDKPQVQKIAPTTFNDIPTETAKQKCYETIARMVASDDWYVKECLTNKIKKDYGIQDVDDYYKKMYSPFPSAKKSDNTKVASAQNIEPEHIDAPIYNDANQSTVANFASAPSMVSTDTNTQQQYKEQFEEPNNQAIDLCEKSGGDWEQNTCNCEKYGMEYNKQKLRCTHPEIPSEKRSAPQLKSDYIAPQKKEVKKIKKTYDATTLITVSVVDHYDSNKKIKGITVCYTNDGSCKTTERNGIITFTQHHHKNESITPQITVKGSDEYECNTPTPIDTTDKSVELPDELVELPDELYELQHKTKPTANQSTNQHQFIIKCKKIEKQKSKKEKNQTKQDQEVTITIVNYYNKSEKIQGVKICTDTDKKDCKKTNKNGTITIKSGEQISIDSDYECNPQIAKVTNNETIKCKQKCTDKDLKKVPNATKCYIKPDNQYEISSCKNGYTPTNNKSACIEFVEEDIDTSILSCDISGGTWTPQINQCICDKNKRLKQSKDQKTCECENSNETYNKKIDKCEDTNAEEIAEQKAQQQAKIAELQENYDNMKEIENSFENRMLGATGMATMGIGGMQLATAMTEDRADDAAEQQMKAYLATFSCTYADGKRFSGGETAIELPGANELINLYSEYVGLANDLKTRKEALGLRAGIEAQPILDSATSGLYDDISTGKTSGAFTSLARALSDPNGADAAAWAAQRAETAEQKKTALTTLGIGTVATVAGNILINRNNEKERSAEIQKKYDETTAGITDILTEDGHPDIVEKIKSLFKKNRKK